MKKKLLVLVMVLIIAGFSTAMVFAGGQTEGAAVKTEDITIGVSIWGINDSLGSQVKKMLDAAGDALDVKVVYIEQSHKSEEVVASVENLCASGVDGIIICNSADAEMARAIPIAQNNSVYISQFFRIIGDPEVEKIALNSSYYLGCTHENETANGYELGRILVEEKNCRNIGMTSYRVGDATANARMVGYKQAVSDWNKANPGDRAILMDVVDDKYTSEEARQAVEGMIDANPTMDGLIVVGGGGQSLEGALAAVKAKGLTGKIHVASTDFTTNLHAQLSNNEISAMSGGHFADPLFSFMMVYNAITGSYNRTDSEYLEVIFPMMFVASADDYSAFDKYFIQSLPYNTEELTAMANGSFKALQDTAAALSIADVKSRR
ncbi:MAG: substrate-binding domain-containing protein [Spirochaetales bacterium]|uniref:Substrate-binding domain-containing protein n=1 Tax=Candidatus Thalassospirochaeta sargassi TaxID=3119039 RepID=A0AAJ1MNI8_9SPIO|nr:substrate-binding domain-containing protein [Spirochaetales bacterium]